MDRSEQRVTTSRPAEKVISEPGVVATLYDPVRYRVFSSLRTPKSVPEVAERLGVTANRLYYHVRRLLDAGLIVQVGVRTAGKHTERIYGHVAERLTVRADIPLQHAADGVGAVLADAVEEIDAGFRAQEAEALGDDAPGLVSWHIGHLTEARARAFQKKLEALVAEFTDRGTPAPAKGAQRFGLLSVLAPLTDEEDAS